MYQLKKIVFVPLCMLLLYLPMSSIYGQVSTNDPLYKAIYARDSLLFEVGFNTCDMKGFEQTVSQDFEFYHDKSGILKGKETFIQAFQKNICGAGRKVVARRELIKSSMQVFPLYNGGVLYGAIQNGEHRFYEKNKLTSVEVATSTAKITHLWILEQNEWMLVRSLSFDHIAKM